MERAQPQTHTMLLRHPNVLASAGAHIEQSGRSAAGLKVLSFGCSIGDEVASLKLMFPRAQVFGCDVSDEVLATARASVGALGEIFRSDEKTLLERGPFDLICAFSSLCIHPPPRAPMLETFSWERFSNLVALLADLLAPGGVLALYNTSYRFQRTAAFADFTRVRSDIVCRNGFVNIYDEAGQVIVEFGTSPTGVSVRSLSGASDLTDDELIDTVFAKTGRSPLSVTLHDEGWAARRGYDPAFAWRRSELDGFALAERDRFIDMRRHYRAFVSSKTGDLLYDCEVRRTSLDGTRELKLATYGPFSPGQGEP